MQPSLAELDRTGWACYRFGQDLLYYGEVAMMDEKGVIRRREDPEAAGRLVRSGLGLQLYPGHFYLGSWARDKKHGHGKATFPDGSSYEGGFKNNMKSEQGRIVWPDGTAYEGGWRFGRFEGQGVLTRQSRVVFGGEFKNGYFVQGGRLVNTLLGDPAQSPLYLDFKLMAKRSKAKHFYFEHARLPSSLHPFLKRSAQHNRFVLALSTAEHEVGLEEVEEALGRPLFVFNVHREFRLREELRAEKKPYEGQREIIRKGLAAVLKQGGVLVINLDDSDDKGVHVPDIAQFYDAGAFPCQIWEPLKLVSPEVAGPVLQGAQCAGDVGVLVWSRERVKAEWDSKRIIEGVEKRFSRLIPFNSADIVVLQR